MLVRGTALSAGGGTAPGGGGTCACSVQTATSQNPEQIFKTVFIYFSAVSWSWLPPLRLCLTSLRQSLTSGRHLSSLRNALQRAPSRRLRAWRKFLRVQPWLALVFDNW